MKSPIILLLTVCCLYIISVVPVAGATINPSINPLKSELQQFQQIIPQYQTELLTEIRKKRSLILQLKGDLQNSLKQFPLRNVNEYRRHSKRVRRQTANLAELLVKLTNVMSVFTDSNSVFNSGIAKMGSGIGVMVQGIETIFTLVSNPANLLQPKVILETFITAGQRFTTGFKTFGDGFSETRLGAETILSFSIDALAMLTGTTG